MKDEELAALKQLLNEKLKKEKEAARAAAYAADAAWGIAWDAYIDARDAYAKKLKELADEDT